MILEIRASKDKVKDIVDYEVPKTLRALRSFLGLSSYYRRFIKDYAFTLSHKYLRGENGTIGTNISIPNYIRKRSL